MSIAQKFENVRIFEEQEYNFHLRFAFFRLPMRIIKRSKNELSSYPR